MPEGPQYTSCIDKQSWQSAIATVGVADIAGAIGAILSVLAGFPAAGVILAFAAGAEIIRKVAGWMLTGKLVCLNNVKRRVFTDPDPDRICVLGTVLDFEKVGEDKSGFENIDNDFGVNLFIAPFTFGAVAAKAQEALQREMERSPQGDLIQDPDSAAPQPGDLNPSPGPLMRKDDPSQKFGPMPAGFTGYQRGLMFSAALARPVPSNVYRDPHELVKQDPQLDQMGKDAYAEFLTEFSGNPIVNGQPLSQAEKDQILADAAKDHLAQPVVAAKFYAKVEAKFAFVEKQAQALHCEFEGSRIRDVYNVLDFAHVHCDTSGFWGFLCDALNFLVSIFLGIPKLIAAAAAWALADDGSLSNAYDGKGGEIKLGDPIVVRGRWAYDSAHSGYNEIHAVRTVQKTALAPADADPYTAYLEFHKAWCSELSKVPPDPPPSRDPQAPPATGADPNMTPAQQATRDAQKRDENRWVYHPAIDGCIPHTVPDPNPAPGLH
jgi:hypothetical protein